MGDLSLHFNRSEFACKCKCGFDTVDIETIKVLEKVHSHFNSPIWIDSGCRCPAYNKKVGGEDKSQHMLGRAADIRVGAIPPSEVQKFLMDEYPSTYGIGRYDNFTHIDTRTGNGPARWDFRSKKE